MPIYDYTYQSWKGVRRGPFFRWMAIPKFTVMEFFGNRTFIWLFSMAWFQFLLVRLVWVYLLINTEFLKAFNIPANILPQADAFFFKNMIDIQIFFCIVFAFQLGADLISRDLIHNALVLYVSKPISRWEYFLGKFSVVFGISMLLTWFQAALLYVMLLAASPENSDWRIYFWDRYAGIFTSITLYSLVIATSLSLLILAASSLTRNKGKAGLTFVMYVIGTGIVAAIIGKYTENDNLRAIWLLRSTYDLGYYLFHIPNQHAVVTLSSAWIGILGNWALCGFIIYWRMNNAAKFSH